MSSMRLLQLFGGLALLASLASPAMAQAPPATPTEVSARLISQPHLSNDFAIFVTWTRNSRRDVDTTYVFRSNRRTGLIDKRIPLSGPARNYADFDLDPNETYSYVVLVANSSGFNISLGSNAVDTPPQYETHFEVTEFGNTYISRFPIAVRPGQEFSIYWWIYDRNDSGVLATRLLAAFITQAIIDEDRVPAIDFITNPGPLGGPPGQQFETRITAESDVVHIGFNIYAFFGPDDDDEDYGPNYGVTVLQD